LKDFGDVFAFVFYLQSLAVIAFAVADVAWDIDIGQEMHLELDCAATTAGFASATLDIEGESP
jgi:hypothetical protein